MADKPILTLEDAKRIAAAAQAEALRNDWRVVIAVVDDGGHLLYLQRSHDTQFGSVETAICKAHAAVRGCHWLPGWMSKWRGATSLPGRQTRCSPKSKVSGNMPAGLAIC